MSTALYAARRGHRVTLFERGGPDRDGCSFGNAGMIVPSHFTPLAAPGMVAQGLKWMWNPESPFYIKPSLDPKLLAWGWQFWKACTQARVQAAAPLLAALGLRSRELFEQLAAESGVDFGLVREGLLMLCKTQRGLDEEARHAAKARELGIPAEVLDAAGTAAKDPSAQMQVTGSVYYQKDCHLTPERFMASLHRLGAVAGVDFRWKTPSLGLNVSASKVYAVKTRLGEVQGDHFVLCGGMWSEPLARQIGLRIPMQAGKGYSLTLPQPRQLPALCSILTEARVAVTPMGGALRFGGTMEMSGMNEDTQPRRVQGIVNAAMQYFPGFTAEDFKDVAPWCGLRPCSPDGLPYVGRTAKFTNLSIATGHAMMGLSLGPITGQLVAQMIDKEKPDFDLSLLSPDRFA